MQHRFIRTWYATENKMQSKSRWLSYSDRGTLTINSDGLDFRGRKTSMSIRRVKKASLANQAFPWVSHILGNIAAFLIVGVLGVAAFSEMSVPPIITSLVLLISFGVAGLVDAVLQRFLQRNSRWVEIEYSGEKNGLRRAYFADGGFGGWSGIFGGTVNMYRTLKINLSQAG